MEHNAELGIMFRCYLGPYFIGQAFEPHPITKHERFAQRVLIAERFGYQLWSADFLAQLVQQAAQIVRRDVTPGFIVAELISTSTRSSGQATPPCRDLISEALSAERLPPGAACEGTHPPGGRQYRQPKSGAGSTARLTSSSGESPCESPPPPRDPHYQPQIRN
jgi:hypothetical protein